MYIGVVMAQDTTIKYSNVRLFLLHRAYELSYLSLASALTPATAPQPKQYASPHSYTDNSSPHK